MTNTMVPVSPKYAIGETVYYTDNHKRPQVGKVTRFTASWTYPENGIVFPLCLYTISHPTYRYLRCVTTANHIHRSEG